MSDTDSFIEEVSEEVRRDRLFGYLKRYGWIGIVAVLALVGGASYNEYSKAQSRAAAQAKGDALLGALEAPDPAEAASALAALEAEGTAASVVAMLQAAAELEGDDPAAAAAALAAVKDDSAVPPVYRDMAALKHAILTAPDTEPDARISALSQLTAPGSVFRVLAEEQIALAEIEKGDTEAAIARLRALEQDVEASQALRTRAQQLIVALGGDTEPA